MLYSLIALGFVLIYKASGVFNFAQGAMVLFSALAMARFSEWIPEWTGLHNKVLANMLAFAIAIVVMMAAAWVIERLVLRRLVNQEGITLLMATLGITYFLDGFGQTVFGSDTYKIEIGLPKAPIFLFENVFQGGVLINKEDLYAAAIAAALVALLTLFFQKTGTCRALRAVDSPRRPLPRRGTYGIGKRPVSTLTIQPTTDGSPWPAILQVHTEPPDAGEMPETAATC